MGTIIQLPGVGAQRLTITCGHHQAPDTTETRGLPHFAVALKISGDGTRTLVKASGDIDLGTAPVLAEILELARHDIETRSGITEIVVDLRPVEFLSAAGLRVLVHASQAFARDSVRFRVAAEHSAVTRPVTIMGLDDVLGLCPHPDYATT